MRSKNLQCFYVTSSKVTGNQYITIIEFSFFFFSFHSKARVHQYQAQISKLQLESESLRGQLRGLEAACAGEVHAALLARLATLETEHAALARDADAQRRQYERCLDDVANQVVRALLSQKVHHPLIHDHR